MLLFILLQRQPAEASLSDRFYFRNTATIYIPLYLQGIAVPSLIVLLAVFWFWINRKYDFGAAVAQEVNGRAPIERLEV